jgi:pyruvate,water dikinase
LGGRENSMPLAAGMEPGGVRFLFRSFKRILAVNTLALERMAQMDRALGGEYLFDRAFLESSVRDVCALTQRAAYHLNGMCGEGAVALYDAALAAKDALEDILCGGMGPAAGRHVLPLDDIGWEMEPLAGLCATGLAALRRMGLPAPDGLAVTVTGMAALAGGGDAGRAGVSELAGAVRELEARLGGQRLLECTVVAAGHAGGGRALASFAERGADKLAANLARFAAANAGLGPLAACVRPLARAVAHGTLQTLAHDPNLPPAMLAVVEPSAAGGTLVSGRDRVWLSRTAPHVPLRARISPKPIDAELPGGKPLDLVRGRLERGSAWVLPAQLAELAQYGLAAERAVDAPCLLGWSLSGQGVLSISSVEPVDSAYPDWAPDDGDPADAVAGDMPPETDLLLSGGQIACSGVGAGVVVRLDEDAAPDSVPLGAVGVAEAASPGLSRVVPRLGALLTRVGSAASHLATVAREHRVPAIFGLPGVLGLAPGKVVTVDAEQGQVHGGVVEVLLRQAALDRASLAGTPEFQILRRLLRHIRPLNLVDPDSDGFRPEGCRTCHDVLHYAHEKAVELLLGMDPELCRGLGEPHRLAGGGALELRVVDLGGALATPAIGREVALEHVESPPLRAFAEGMRLPGLRRSESTRLGLGDIVSGLGRTAQAMNAPAAASGLNLALAARDYANITLRLGYHFSVVDAVATDRPEQNFLYFRFAGGFADGDRRARRAALIERVLVLLGFRTSRKGDLVLGRRRHIERAEVLDGLRLLGALSVFTRQLDVELAEQADAVRYAARFIEACVAAGLKVGVSDPEAGFVVEEDEA